KPFARPCGRTAPRPPPLADRGAGAGHRRPLTPRGPHDCREDRYRPAVGRQGPWLVPGLCPRRRARARGRCHHGRDGARLRRRPVRGGCSRALHPWARLRAARRGARSPAGGAGGPGQRAAARDRSGFGCRFGPGRSEFRWHRPRHRARHPDSRLIRDPAMRLAGFDRQLASVAFALMLYGLVVLYSAGQTDVATSAAGIWHRQFVWFAVGLCVGFIAFKTSFRLLEWVAPAIYALGLILLIAVLVVGTGAGTAAGTKSWLAIGGHRIGQPAEFAKLATVLMLARYLSSLKEPPRSLRDLWVPCAIIVVPFLLVMRQ